MSALIPPGPPTVTVTFFADFAATTKREERLTLTVLADLIRQTTAGAKQSLPWLKLARFGDTRTDKNSLRHNANVLVIGGIEGDADNGQVNFEAAIQHLRAAGIAALIYTSPSHTEDAARWRALCPLSTEYPPSERDRFMARLNGALSGVLANESWALSQSYYYGSVNRNPSHQAVVIEGVYIDLADHLDATAIGKPERPRPNGDGRHGPATRPEDISDARIRGLVDKLLDNVRNASDGTKHHTLFDIGRTLGGYLCVIGWSEHEAVEQLCAALPSSVADWDAAHKTAAQAVALGATQPLELEDRPNPRQRQRDTDPPPPDPPWNSDVRPNEGQPSIDDQPKLDPQEDEPDEQEPLVGAALPDLFVMKADLPLVSRRLRDCLGRHPWLFERGGPARLVNFPAEPDRQAEVHQLGGDAVVHAAHEVCRPYQINWRGKRSNVTLPERVAKLYLALNGRWSLRPLHGICCSVLLDPDGGIHSHEGYHAPTGMWCTRPPPLSVPERPFKDQAVDALYRLRTAMRTFTFKGSPLVERDGNLVVDIEQNPGLCESAGLCGLLTAVCRASLPLAPGVMINAPSLSGSGAGKGLLARMMIAIGLGIVVEATAAGHDEAEFEKRIGTALLSGDPAVLLDNLNNTLLRSAQLESCLTEPLVGVRLFGHLKKQMVRAIMFVVLTGNGLQASGDAARRYVYPTLEPPLDNPEQRKYPPGFLEDIIARRGELLSDCLTIWRWGRQQSNLKHGLPFGSYERWTSWVRDPLLALGCDDPVKGVKQARAQDSARVNLSALFMKWREYHIDAWVKADDLDWHVRRLVDDKERVPAIRQKLALLADTRLDGFKLESKVEGNAANRGSLYRVVAVEGDAEEPGGALGASQGPKS